MIYENSDLVDFNEEFEQTVIQFRKIYEFCNSVDLKADLMELDYRGTAVRDLMEKRKEINRLNILMLDEISNMVD